MNQNWGYVPNKTRLPKTFAEEDGNCVSWSKVKIIIVAKTPQKKEIIMPNTKCFIFIINRPVNRQSDL